jgi:hypothetical protein
LNFGFYRSTVLYPSELLEKYFLTREWTVMEKKILNVLARNKQTTVRKAVDVLFLDRAISNCKPIHLLLQKYCVEKHFFPNRKWYQQ